MALFYHFSLKLEFHIRVSDNNISKFTYEFILSDYFLIFLFVLILTVLVHIELRMSKLYKIIAYNSFKYHALNNEATKSKLSLIVKREDERNKCKTGASLSDEFVKSIIQLCEIAHKFKQERNSKTSNLLNYE